MLSRSAADYTAVAERIQSAAARLRTLSIGHDMTSQATDAVRVQAADVADQVDRAHARYAAAGSALSTYAGALEAVQQDARSALAEARLAQEAADGAESERRWRLRELDDAEDAARRATEPAALQAAEQTVRYWRRLVTQAQQDAADAETRLQQARDRVPDLVARARVAADTARGSISGAMADDGLTPTFWEKVGDVALQVTHVLAQVSVWVAGAAGIAAFICSIVPFMQPFAAVLGTIALVASIVNLVSTAVLAACHEASLTDLAWSAVAVASFGAGRAVSALARTSAARAVGTAVLQARSVAPAAGRTVSSLLRSPYLAKMSNARATALAAQRFSWRESSLAWTLRARLSGSASTRLIAQEVGERTAWHLQVLKELDPALMQLSPDLARLNNLTRLAEAGVVGGVRYTTFDSLVGVRNLVEGVTGSGYSLPALDLLQPTWLDDAFDPIDSQAALHLPGTS